MMRRQDFYYHLPEELIAKTPAPERTGSRLLNLDGETWEVDHKLFHDILDFIDAGYLLIFNDTRVIPARLFGQKESGGKVEVLVERVLSERQILAQMRASKSPKPGSFVLLEDGTKVCVVGREGAFFVLEFAVGVSATAVLDRLGHMPLPPYIDRDDTLVDRERYQTVYGKNQGAVAAPTAGLHFDEPLMEKLAEKGVEFGFVTLHVGAGTFQPVRADDVTEHNMHAEFMVLSDDVCEKVRAAKKAGKRVIAVGTTSVRCLETAASTGQIEPYQGDTDIFIFPGYSFKIVDALITNFHLPESTVLMLISAFAGWRNTMNAYAEAVEQKYRFFSYGDAMFIRRNPRAMLEIPGG